MKKMGRMRTEFEKGNRGEKVTIRGFTTIAVQKTTKFRYFIPILRTLGAA